MVLLSNITNKVNSRKSLVAVEGFDAASLEEKQFTDGSTIVAVDAEGKVYKARYKCHYSKMLVSA